MFLINFYNSPMVSIAHQSFLFVNSCPVIRFNSSIFDSSVHHTYTIFYANHLRCQIYNRKITERKKKTIFEPNDILQFLFFTSSPRVILRFANIMMRHSRSTSTISVTQFGLHE